jgi:DNA invertase Pin-like site-specific DNA recombinase
MSKKIALYARVSTENQDLTNQVEKLEEHAEKEGREYDMYKEKVSSVEERPEFDKLMERLEDYEYLAITKLDRFGRSLRQMLENIEKVNEKCDGIVVIDDELSIDTRGDSTMQQKIMTNFLSLFADVERRMIRQRLEEGYDKAHQEGRVGRPEKLTDDEKEELAALYESGRFRWNGLAEKYDVSKTTISKALKEKGVL